MAWHRTERLTASRGGPSPCKVVLDDGGVGATNYTAVINGLAPATNYDVSATAASARGTKISDHVAARTA